MFVPSETIVSNSLKQQVEDVVNIWICLTVSIFGMVTNSLTITVFAHQGFKESVIISLMSIAVWDFMACFSGCATRVYGIIAIFDRAVAVSWENIATAFLLYTHVFSCIVSGCLASYVAIERCLCVTCPFDVKRIMTPARTTIAMVLISLITFGSLTHMFFVSDLRIAFSYKLNATIVDFSFSTFMKRNAQDIILSYNILPVFWPALSFIILLTCTHLILKQLRISAKFQRESTTVNSNRKPMTSRKETKVSKMLLMVILCYLLSMLPRLMTYFVRAFNNEFMNQGALHNLFWLVSYFVYFFNLVNASVNFLIYINMSSTFNASFRQLSLVKKCHQTLQVFSGTETLVSSNKCQNPLSGN